VRRQLADLSPLLGSAGQAQVHTQLYRLAERGVMLGWDFGHSSSLHRECGRDECLSDADQSCQWRWLELRPDLQVHRQTSEDRATVR